MNIINSIGNTPLVEIKTLNPKRSRVKIFGKLEGLNPGGSIKDRAAFYMLKKAEYLGQLEKGKTILEATSGNTGIALAMLGASMDYRVKLVMPENVSIERRQILEALGARVELTPSEEGTDGAIRRTQQFQKENPDKFYVPDQFKNENNPLAHYETTGPEIFDQTKGNIDVFVAGMGTTGTLMGAGKYLREKKPEVTIVGVEPVMGHQIQGLKNMKEAIVPAIYQPDQLDFKLTIEDHDAFETTRKLAWKEGLLVGMSSGAAAAGALQMAERMDSGVIVAILPDRGDRYLSTFLFRHISKA